MKITHRFYKTVMVIAMVLMTLGLPISASASAINTQSQPSIDATVGLAVDADTGQLLYSKNINKPMALASMSKLLSLYIVRKAIAEGKISWDQYVPITPALHSLSVDSEYANAPLAHGNDNYTVRQIYQASFESANAAMMSLANLVGGSTQNFTLMMRKTAKELGIKDAQLYTACGLTNGEVGSLGMPNASDDAENKMSARDLAIIAKQFMKQFPDVLKNTSVSEYTLEGKTLRNGDYMLAGGTQAVSDLPVQGLKTGTSSTCGGSFIGTTNRDGHRIITVVMHASNTEPTDPGRFIQTKKIMYYVYDHYRYVSVAKNSDTAYKSVAVPSGKDTQVGIKTDRAFHYWIPKDQSSSSVKLNLKSNLTDGKGIKAPVAANKKVGDLVFNAFKNYDGHSLSVAMSTNTTVDKANIFVRFWRGLMNLF